MAPDLEHMLTTSQAARALDVSEPRVRQMIAAGELPATKTALGRLFDPQDVAAVAAARQARQSGAPATGA